MLVPPLSCGSEPGRYQSDDAAVSRPARIALYGSGGAPYHHAGVLARAGHAVEFVFAFDILQGAIDGFDAFVMPGGGYRAMQGQIDPLGRAGARAIREYVSSGGMYIGSCAGSYDAARTPRSFLNVCPAQADLCLSNAEIWNAGNEWQGLQSPGVGVLVSRNASPDHPVMEGMPEYFEITHYNGPLFRGGDVLATVDSVTENFTPAERFLGDYKGQTLIDEAERQHIPNIVAGSLGNGRVVLFGSHPEFGSTLGMEDEPRSARMLVNAIKWQLDAQNGMGRRNTAVYSQTQPLPEDDCVGQARRAAERVRAACEELKVRDGDPPWLRNAYAMSVFGLQPRTIWELGLDTICGKAQEIQDRAGDVAPRVLAFRTPHDWETDGGYHGVLALTEQTEQLLRQALDDWNIDLGEPVAEAYAYATSSPFHLVAGSYLAALGRMVGAGILCEIAGKGQS